METPIDTLNLYCLTSRSRFAPFADDSEPGLVPTVGKICGPRYATRRVGIWGLATPAAGHAPSCGWKLHVSLSLDDYVEGLTLAARDLAEVDVAFKFVADRSMHQLTHSPWWSRSQSGKDIVVYPPGPREARTLAERLQRLLAHLEPGPRVLSDLQFQGSPHVFYRYGAFERRVRPRPDGSPRWLLNEAAQIEDVRHPWYVPPEGVADPFQDSDRTEAREGAPGKVILAERYQPVSAIKFTNAGGVYRANDLLEGGTVIIKEARPGVVFPRCGWSAPYALRREHDQQAGLDLGEWFAEPLAVFEQDGHAFSVQEDLGGELHLGQWSIAHNPVYSKSGAFGDYLARYWSLIRGVATALERLHRQGVALGDLSFTNVVIDHDRPRVVDFGAAFRPGAEDHPGIYTRGLGPSLTPGDGFERDVRALGYLICGGFILPAGISELDRRAPLRMARLIADEHGGHLLLEVAERCMGAEADSSSEILEAVGAVDLRDDSPPRGLARPRGSRGLAEVLVGSLSRRDPGDVRVSPLAYERHPASLAWGSGGPLFVLGAVGTTVSSSRYQAWLDTLTGPDPGLPPGLYPGWAGVAETALVCGDPTTARWAIARAIEGAEDLDDYSYWQGLAGVSIACLDVARSTQRPDLFDQATSLAQRAYASYRAAEPDDRPHGLAYGAAGLLLALCQEPLVDRVVDPAALAALADAATTCARPTPAGHLSCVPDPSRSNVFRHYLNDGSAGLASALAAYYKVSGSEDVKSTIERLLPDLDRLLTATPALWTGFSGLGMSLLDVAAALERDDLRVAAGGIADRLQVFWVSQQAAFPGEQNLRLSDDLVAGTSGVLAFLWRAERPRSRPNILPGFA